MIMRSVTMEHEPKDESCSEGWVETPSGSLVEVANTEEIQTARV